MARRARSAGLHPTTALLRLSVLLGASAGFSLGLLLLGALEKQRAEALPWAALAQVHGQVQTVGFVGLFVLGTAAQLLPGFLSVPLVRPRQITLGGYLVALALILRAITQPMAASPVRNLAVVLSAVGELAGVALCLASYCALHQRSIQPPDLWRRLALIGFGCLALAIGLNVVAAIVLAMGRAVVPANLDAALIQLELWGFVVFLVYAVSRKILPRFLLLQPPDDSRIWAGALCSLAGLGLTSFGWLLTGSGAVAEAGLLRAIGSGAQLVGGLLYLDGLRIYRAPVRASGAPAVTDPARRWIRLAFVWLIVANLLAVINATQAVLAGGASGFFAITAERHALAQGFVLTIMVAYGSRILPGFSAWAIQRPRLTEATIGLITLGALLRVVGEISAASQPGLGEELAASGATLAVVGFLVFAVSLARTVGRIPKPAG